MQASQEGRKPGGGGGGPPAGGKPPKGPGGGKKGGGPASGLQRVASGTPLMRVYVETSLQTKLLLTVHPGATIAAVRGAPAPRRRRRAVAGRACTQPACTAAVLPCPAGTAG